MTNRTCSIEGCGSPHYGRGWCSKHYQRWQAHGDPLVSLLDRESSALERYESKIDRLTTPDGCHPWLAGRTVTGYGKFDIGAKPAHRWGYEHLIGPIPDGMFVCHTCDNPPCQNPAHWFLGTPADNMADKVAKCRQSRMPGRVNPAAKLTEMDVVRIRELYAGGGFSQKRLATTFGVTQMTISYIVRRTSWAHIA